MLEDCLGGLETLREQAIYLAEAISGFALRLKQLVPGITLSEFLDGVPDGEAVWGDIVNQNLEALNFADRSFDLVITSEVFEHIENLPKALAEIARVLRPGGRLVATCPLALGQFSTITKARREAASGRIQFLGEPDFHGDPLRPEEGAVVFQIPGWDLLDQLSEAGFRSSAVHHIVSWKHGVLGHDIPGVLVLEAQR
ncbi:MULTISPECIES: methyltransferase domain-containing protein [unclassified Synechococcus]|uniref:methyltransferase domain-containing protein n=1 Tax=unclassified Synechococcus TaxID=2626047 RepID=UPI0020CC945C|nr:MULTISPECIES: methyltransferase domain-containing protein [unclassified Synechococcus]